MIDPDDLDTDLTPEICRHAMLEEFDDGALCEECYAILYKAESPITQEVPHESELPQDGDLDTEFTTHL